MMKLTPEVQFHNNHTLGAIQLRRERKGDVVTVSQNDTRVSTKNITKCHMGEGEGLKSAK